MTRINLIPVEELSDQHLIAEYHELPRVIKQKIDTTNAPERYCLGKGHMKWAKRYLTFCIMRYKLICKEMTFRNFAVNYSYDDMLDYWYYNIHDFCEDYHVSSYDIKLSRDRIIEKIKQKPAWYRWTNRPRPTYIK